MDLRNTEDSDLVLFFKNKKWTYQVSWSVVLIPFLVNEVRNKKSMQGWWWIKAVSSLSFKVYLDNIANKLDDQTPGIILQRLYPELVPKFFAKSVNEHKWSLSWV